MRKNSEMKNFKEALWYARAAHLWFLNRHLGILVCPGNMERRHHHDIKWTRGWEFVEKPHESQDPMVKRLYGKRLKEVTKKARRKRGKK